MANTVTWNVASITTLLTTELNALANGSGSALGTEYDNATNKFLFGDFELVLNTLGAAATANATVDLYLIPKTDGTNYSQGGTTAQPANSYKGSWVMLATTTARLTIHGVPLPPLAFKAFVVNRCGQAFNATSSTVKMVPYGYLIT